MIGFLLDAIVGSGVIIIVGMVNGVVFMLGVISGQEIMKMAA